MKKIIFLIFLSFAFNLTKGQISRTLTSPGTIASQVPGYNEVSSIITKTVSYTPSTPPTDPTPIDDDPSTEDDKIYNYADVLPVSINIADGNISSCRRSPCIASV